MKESLLFKCDFSNSTILKAHYLNNQDDITWLVRYSGIVISRTLE